MKGVINKKLISIVGGILAISILCCFILIGINLPKKENNNNKKDVTAASIYWEEDGDGTKDNPYIVIKEEQN